MKQLFIALFMLVSLSAFGATDTYICSSYKGSIMVKDFEDGSLVVDFDLHPMTRMDHSYEMLSEMVETGFQSDFIVILNEDHFVQKPGNKFENGFAKASIKSRISRSLQTCRMSFTLNKIRETAALSYSCSTLFKKTRRLVDSLDCSYSSTEQ